MMSGHLDKYQETYDYDTFQALAKYMEDQQLRWRRGFRMNDDGN
jgi:bisphosphoglycerate-dependent phosphoglycerate mutase